MTHSAKLFASVLVLSVAGCGQTRPESQGSAAPSGTPAQPATQALDITPEWAADAVFYQIFPERFRNGDPENDPTRASLEFGITIPENWQVSPWTGDWYEKADWEREMSATSFYGSDEGRRLGRGEGKDIIATRRYGGDLQGVIDKLDYLKELGVNALYFNPLFWARSHHKYDGNTFHHIDPYFGPDPEGDFEKMATETSDPATWKMTEADELFVDLVDEAHDRGLRVVIDGVWNHTGRDFFAFQDVVENQERSPYKDWYIIKAWDDPATPENEFRYHGWWDVATLPEFNNNADSTSLHPGPSQYIFDATARWMDPDGDGDPSDGVDGWRLDVVPDVPMGFWADWHRHVKELNPNVYTTAEIWFNAADYLDKGGFTATMNYHAFAFPVKGFLVDNTMPPSQFAEHINARREVYPKAAQYVMQNLMDSHDTARLASMIVNAGRFPYENAENYDYDTGSRVSPVGQPEYLVRKPNEQERAVQRLVGLFQMTYLGAPMIYYGTEAGMWGADDPDDRQPMIWADLDYEPQAKHPLGRSRTPDAVEFDEALFKFYQDVIKLRNDHVALRRGDFRVLAADDERDVFSYSRTSGDQTLAVVLNRSNEAHSIRIPLPAELRGSYEIVMTTGDTAHRLQQDAEALLIEIPALTGLVLRRK